MAGAGYKLFNTGDVLTAAQVNTYLQEQVVMVFNDATARTTALSGVLAEGMVSYLKSTKVVEIYNGTAWASLDDPNAIQNTIVDAKGDLITATGNDVPARLAVSATNNMVLVTDSAQSTGLKWSSDYTAYTPSWSVNAGTAPSLGNGTLTGRYLLVGKLCHVQIFFQGGSTTTYGSGGVWQFTLPFASNELSGNTGGFAGGGYAEDAAVAGYQILGIRKGGGAQSIQMLTNVNTSITSVSPFTWGTNDFLNIQIVYGVA